MTWGADVPDFNLVIVHTRRWQDIADWWAVAAAIEAAAPDIEVGIANNDRRNLMLRRWQETRPSLVFSASVLRKYRPTAGKIYAGTALTKLEEVERFRAAGVPTPPTELWDPDKIYPSEIWGENVIVKPLRGLRGDGISLLPSNQLASSWERHTDSGQSPFMVQRFVDTGARPHHFRVLTGFGVPLYATRRWAMQAGGGQERAPRDPQWRLVSNASGDRELTEDSDVLALAKTAAAALSEVPVLGCDIVREERTGKLFALEANSYGMTWHLSSDAHATAQSQTTRHLDYYGQFGALDLLATELIRRVRAEAR